ncbi:MAG: hypothetical protein WDN28_24705 [Chthoniobacter sp.]
MAIDGRLAGNTTAGTRQLRNSSDNTQLPNPSKLSLTFRSQDTVTRGGLLFPTISPTPPKIVFKQVSSQRPADDFELGSDGQPLPLRGDRAGRLVLSSDLVNFDGFGSLTIDNSDGDILVPNDVAMTTAPGGSIVMKAANIDIRGDLSAPGGSLDFTAYDFSPYEADILKNSYALGGSSDFKIPRPDGSRGTFTLAGSASLSTAGNIVDDQFTADSPLDQPIVKNGGTISIQSYNADLQKGGVVDVSGGLAMSVTGKASYGNAGGISILAGQDPKIASLTGGRLKLASTLKGYSGAKGGSLALQAPLIRIGSDAAGRGEFNLAPRVFRSRRVQQLLAHGPRVDSQTPEPLCEGSGFSIDSAIKPVLPNRFLAGLVVEPDRHHFANRKSLIAMPVGLDGEGTILQQILLAESLRSPVTISLTAKGVTDFFSSLPVVRGDVLLGEGAEVRAGPLGNVSLTGDTVAVLGSVSAPGGNISVKGGFEVHRCRRLQSAPRAGDRLFGALQPPGCCGNHGAEAGSLRPSHRIRAARREYCDFRQYRRRSGIGSRCLRHERHARPGAGHGRLERDLERLTGPATRAGDQRAAWTAV